MRDNVTRTDVITVTTMAEKGVITITMAVEGIIIVTILAVMPARMKTITTSMKNQRLMLKQKNMK